MMELRISKSSGNLHTIVYKRSDASEFWQRSDDFFIRHDLSHFAIEKILGFKTAFMGMINNGMGARDFEDREKRKIMIISSEAWYAENMANLFLMEITQGELENFNLVSQDAFRTMKLPIPLPVFGNEEINSIRTCLRQLLKQWSRLPVNETMILTIDV